MTEMDKASCAHECLMVIKKSFLKLPIGEGGLEALINLSAYLPEKAAFALGKLRGGKADFIATAHYALEIIDALEAHRGEVKPGRLNTLKREIQDFIENKDNENAIKSILYEDNGGSGSCYRVVPDVMRMLGAKERLSQKDIRVYGTAAMSAIDYITGVKKHDSIRDLVYDGISHNDGKIKFTDSNGRMNFDVLLNLEKTGREYLCIVMEAMKEMPPGASISIIGKDSSKRLVAVVSDDNELVTKAPHPLDRWAAYYDNLEMREDITIKSGKEALVTVKNDGQYKNGAGVMLEAYRRLVACKRWTPPSDTYLWVGEESEPWHDEVAEAVIEFMKRNGYRKATFEYRNTDLKRIREILIDLKNGEESVRLDIIEHLIAKKSLIHPGCQFIIADAIVYTLGQTKKEPDDMKKEIKVGKLPPAMHTGPGRDSMNMTLVHPETGLTINAMLYADDMIHAFDEGGETGLRNLIVSTVSVAVAKSDADDELKGVIAKELSDTLAMPANMAQFYRSIEGFKANRKLQSVNENAIFEAVKAFDDLDDLSKAILETLADPDNAEKRAAAKAAADSIIDELSESLGIDRRTLRELVNPKLAHGSSDEFEEEFHKQTQKAAADYVDRVEAEAAERDDYVTVDQLINRMAVMPENSRLFVSPLSTKAPWSQRIGEGSTMARHDSAVLEKALNSLPGGSIAFLVPPSDGKAPAEMEMRMFGRAGQPREPRDIISGFSDKIVATGRNADTGELFEADFMPELIAGLQRKMEPSMIDKSMMLYKRWEGMQASEIANDLKLPEVKDGKKLSSLDRLKIALASLIMTA